MRGHVPVCVSVCSALLSRLLSMLWFFLFLNVEHDGGAIAGGDGTLDANGAVEAVFGGAEGEHKRPPPR